MTPLEFIDASAFGMICVAIISTGIGFYVWRVWK